MDRLGWRAHLLSYRICESPLRVAAMGTCFPDETSSSASLARGTAFGGEIHRTNGLILRSSFNQSVFVSVPVGRGHGLADVLRYGQQNKSDCADPAPLTEWGKPTSIT